MAEDLPVKCEVVLQEVEEKEIPEGYLEKVEKQAETQVTDLAVQDNNQQLAIAPDDTAQGVALPANAVILPATQSSFNQGAEADVKMSAKWLTTWCMFMIKKYGSRVFFKGE